MTGGIVSQTRSPMGQSSPLITLVGIALNATLGWWWADPVAALGMTWFLVAEGREAWRGEDCGCSGAGAAG